MEIQESWPRAAEASLHAAASQAGAARLEVVWARHADEVQALIKSDLKCGAKVLGPSAWDPDFGVADLPMPMDLAELPRSDRTRFLGR